MNRFSSTPGCFSSWYAWSWRRSLSWSRAPPIAAPRVHVWVILTASRAPLLRILAWYFDWALSGHGLWGFSWGVFSSEELCASSVQVLIEPILFHARVLLLLVCMVLETNLELVSSTSDRPSSCACGGDSYGVQSPLLLRIFGCSWYAQLLLGASPSSSLGCKCGLHGVTFCLISAPPLSLCA